MARLITFLSDVRQFLLFLVGREPTTDYAFLLLPQKSVLDAFTCFGSRAEYSTAA